LLGSAELLEIKSTAHYALFARFIQDEPTKENKSQVTPNQTIEPTISNALNCGEIADSSTK
jgi:hypothetical protein